ncbi:uncharacterized protein LOC133167007 isoform X2 [Syngnathus typhle]|uniref:uncharacterized protein LOC133167007 isoform X2 n=1 Tax=Syngnathus typhle TaxID=161592 RepID=UPI002A6A5E2E|nr:uncharacterized protein LOC133167007 isoform X2 [Syngnathus typhle]XP_061153463.1 uncharacterized protein LOC133167007 isoform X2 [Syngnathus typhle]
MEQEQLRDQVTTTLCRLEWDQLVGVCNFLKGSNVDDTGENEEAIKKLSRRDLMKLIENKIDEVEQSHKSVEVVQFIDELLVFIRDTGWEGDARERSTFYRPTDVTRNYEELRVELKALQEKLKMVDISPAVSQSSSPAKISEVTIRREFRICGQIGESGQRERLSYTNLLHQMELGLRKGHSESEVIEAVKLRDMLELKTDITLSQLKTILRGHYREDETSDLYQKLINLSQEPKESPQDFLFRAIELEDRLLDAFKGEPAEHYNADLVKKNFFRSVGTGLLNDNIKFQLKSLLDNLEVTDERLIERLNEAANLEAERLNKLRRSGIKQPRINELQTSDERQGGVHTTPSQDTAVVKEKIQRAAAPPEVQAMVAELKTEVAEMKQMVLNSLNAGKFQPARKPTYNTQRRRGCRTCQDNGEGDNCTHCFKCGQAGHISRGCRAPPLLQGNARGPLPWDQQ